jgi:hypothetical protein
VNSIKKTNNKQWKNLETCQITYSLNFSWVFCLVLLSFSVLVILFLVAENIQLQKLAKKVSV